MKANEFDSIIFDCDGVLIDVTKSYDTTINKTISYAVKEMSDITVETPLTNEILLGFKSTGGFNDEVDIAYVSILCYIAAKKLNRNPTDLIFDVIDNADDSGIKSAENFLDKTGTITSEKSKLDYPGTSKNNYVRSIFDQLFYGPELYNKIFQKNSMFTERGLIENDDIIVSSKLIQVLKKRFSDKIAVVTGRGYNAINSSLKEILTQFNVENSVFLEDEPRNLAKPNPESLIRSIKGLNSKNCLYVGDSMEDLIMAQRASELGFQTTFCGIYGSGKLPEVKKKFFVERNVPFILESINFIPKALNLV